MALEEDSIHLVHVILPLAILFFAAILFLKDKTKAFRVGIGIISRGEVGLIMAGVGVSTGALSSDIYTTVIIMVALTTIITPIWLKRSYINESN